MATVVIFSAGSFCWRTNQKIIEIFNFGEVSFVQPPAFIVSHQGFVWRRFCLAKVLSGEGFVGRRFCLAKVLSGEGFVGRRFCRAKVL